MILCAVDDLIFSIKVSTAAKSLHANVYFERSGDRLLETIRDKRPSLVIFDLNSARLRPLDAIAALKRAYRLFFNSDLNLGQALERARTDLADLPEVSHFLSFVSSSQRGVPA